MTVATEAPKLRRKDFVPDQEVRWCPGCGDYAVLAQIQNLLIYFYCRCCFLAM